VSEWVVLLHVLVAFWFVAGLIGRNVTFAKVRASSDLRTVEDLMELGGRFERLMVIPGVLVAGLLAAWAEGQPLAGEGNWWLLISLALFVSLAVLVPVVFLPRGKVFERVLEDARARGEVTPELTASLRDPAVRNARAIELIVVVVVIVLMVTKPL
jgi:hypothetical protein